MGANVASSLTMISPDQYSHHVAKLKLAVTRAVLAPHHFNDTWLFPVQTNILLKCLFVQKKRPHPTGSTQRGNHCTIAGPQATLCSWGRDLRCAITICHDQTGHMHPSEGGGCAPSIVRAAIKAHARTPLH